MTLNMRTALASGEFGTHPLWRQQAGLAWHSATDYPGPRSDAIESPDAGEVVYTGPGFSLGDLGYYTILDAGHYGLLMAHQDSPFPDVLGIVNRGDHVGYVGNTGFSTGPHVHAVMSVKRLRNGRHDFTRESGALVDPEVMWDTGYTSEAVWTRIFNVHARPSALTAVVTKRIVTKSELSLIGTRSGATFTLQGLSGDWSIFDPSKPAFTHALFPNLIPASTAMFVRRD